MKWEGGLVPACGDTASEATGGTSMHRVMPVPYVHARDSLPCPGCH